MKLSPFSNLMVASLVTVLLLCSTPVFPADTSTMALTLEEAQRIALRENENLQVNRNDVKIADQDLNEAWSKIYPEITVSGQSERRKQTTSFGFPRPESATDFSASLVQPLYEGGKNLYGVNIRDLEKKMQKKTLFRRKQIALFKVAEIYFEVLLSKSNVDIQRNTLKRARKQLQRAKSRKRVGKTTQNAVLRAQVQVSEAKEELTQAKNDVQLAREDLAVVLGVNNLHGKIKSEPSTQTLSDTDISKFKSKAFNERRDLKRVKFQIEALRERVKFENADYYPSFDLVGRYDRFDNETFQGTEEDWRLTLQGSYPLFSGWREESQSKRARLRYKNVRQEYKRLKREIRRDVRRVHLQLKTQLKVIQTLRNRLKSARENHKEITARFEEGLVDAVAVSDAITILKEASLRLASAQIKLQLDRLRLKLAAGTYSENLIEKEGNFSNE